MPRQVIAADLTVPAGTPVAAPVSLLVPIASGWISEASLTIPNGPSGLAGWQLVLAGTVIVPYAGAGFVVGNDHVYTWRLDRWCNAGQLLVRGYNTGAFPHTFYFLADWQPNEPGLSAQVSLADNGPATQATTAAVAGMVGFDTEPDTAAELAASGG